MCRIIGEVSFKGELTPFEQFRFLTSLSKTGGPDSTGFWNDDLCRFGFNRLSIIDVSENGNQPVLSPSGRYAMVFNGEIYNYKELKTKFGITSERLRSSSDTEIIAHLLDLLPVEKMTAQLDGMYAIAVWDRTEKQLHLIRDFAGIKPLHFGVNPNGIVFASQYNQIVRHNWFCNEPINSVVLAEYLKRHYIPAPDGLRMNTFQVSPGEIVTINRTHVITRKRYWELPRYVESTISDRNEALEFIAHELEKSVKAQLMSDVPLGAFLSGGIDSPLICKYAQKNIKEKLKTFTIGSESRVHDESSMALDYSSRLNADTELEIMNSNSAASILEEVMKTVVEPFADTSIIPTFLVSKLAARKVKVALSGDGGDELFYGYERFWSVAKNLPWQSLPYPLRYMAYGADKVISHSSNINSVVIAKSQGAGHQKLHSGTVFNDFQALAPDLSFNAGYVSPEYRYRNLRSESELVQQMRYSEFYDMMQKTLRKVDLASMGNSLEVRVPFLQKNFIEASMKVDFSVSYGRNKKKEVLKGLIKREYPGITIDNNKKGFSVPFTRWLREDLKQQFQEVLLDKSLNDYFGFSVNNVESILDRHLYKGDDNKWLLFSLYSLFKWQSSLHL